MIESTTCGSIKTHFMRKMMTVTIWNVDKDVIYEIGLFPLNSAVKVSKCFMANYFLGLTGLIR